MLTEGDVIVGRPSRGTPKDRRLKENKRRTLFGGRKAAPFKKGGKRRGK